MKRSPDAPLFKFEHTYADRLPVGCVAARAAPAPRPRLLQLNRPLADELGLNLDAFDPQQLADMFAGNHLPSGAKPVAQAYAGHQFGGFVPLLGDGRAMLLGEVIDRDGRRRDIALKGSGPTPFARGGDGKAAVGPVLREYLLSEAMHALGVPTTRSLAAVATGSQVLRDRVLPGAVLTRVAASHLRVGTFEYFAIQRRPDQLRALADYAIARHDPELASADDPYGLLLQAVCDRQARLVAQWMLYGFIHGVMNTDNMAISGETIDYGPCAFLENYDPETVFSSIDLGGRYAYGNQPFIARWNLARFAEAILPLLDPTPERGVDKAMEVLERFLPAFESAWLAGVRAKLGLHADSAQDETDRELARDWLQLLHQHQVDFTLGWRHLAAAATGDWQPLSSLFGDVALIEPWAKRWQSRLAESGAEDGAERIRAANPLYIPRNHLVEEALTAAADAGDLAPLERLLEAIRRPFAARPGLELHAEPAPPQFTACYRTFCGT